MACGTGYVFMWFQLQFCVIMCASVPFVQPERGCAILACSREGRLRGGSSSALMCMEPEVIRFVLLCYLN